MLKILTHLHWTRVPTMATVKAKLETNPPVYNIKEINHFFNIDSTGCVSDEDYIKKYMDYLISSRAKFSEIRRTHEATYEKLFEANKTLKIFEFSKHMITTKYKNLTSDFDNTINNFTSFCLATLIKYNATLKFGSIAHPSAIECFTAINHLFPLLTLTKFNCMAYLRVMGKWRFYSKFIHISEYLSNYRVCVEELMKYDVNLFTQEQIVEILYSASLSNINHLHYEKSLQVIHHFWKGVDKNWHKDMRNRKRLVYTLNRLECYSEEILDQVMEVLEDRTMKLEVGEEMELIDYLIKFKRINDKTFSLPRYQKLFSNLIQHPDFNEKHYIKKLYNNMYRAQIWMVDFWKRYFKSTSRNGLEGSDEYHFFSIMRILQIDSDIIPQEIIQASESCKSLFQKMQSEDDSKKFMNDLVHKQSKISSISCQTQLANSLRIINIGSVRTEVLIDFFIVDIVVNDRFAIEVNGNTHLLFNIETFERLYNLKTENRKRILEKLGYGFYDVNLEDYNEGSFEIIENVYTRIKNQESEALQATTNSHKNEK